MPKVTISTEDFDRLLAEVMDADAGSASGLLVVPGVYELVSEYYNNDVLAAYDVEQAENAVESEE